MRRLGTIGARIRGLAGRAEARPDFLGIGAQRAGTSWLHGMLSRHPRVFLPEEKELHFFDEPLGLGPYEGVGVAERAEFRDPGSARDWRWYERQFRPGRGRVRGEITPFYAVLSEARAGLVARRLPGVKAVYVLRNPVKRAWSAFRLSWFLRTGHRDAGYDADLVRRSVLHPAKLIHGDYRRNAGIWERALGADRILYLSFDDVVERPQEALDRVCAFLGVSPLRLPDRDLAARINAAPESPMPDGIERALEDRFADQAEFLRARFGRDLRH